MKLVFATNNRHKLEEISAIIGDKIGMLRINTDTIALPTTRDCKWRR